MTSYTANAGQRNGRCYQLELIADNGGKQTQYFDSLEDLARAAYSARLNRERYDRFAYYYDYLPARTDHWVLSHMRACSFRGKALDVLTLCTWGATLGRYRYRYCSNGYVRRKGSVPGIRKWRGGPRYRHSHTMALRRQNAGWLVEEGEVECRPCQRDTYLYHSWDGRHRPVERCWKSQHKGRKAWDRT